MGILQAVDAVKYLTEAGVPLVNKILQFDAMLMDICVIDIYKDPSCSLCGSATAKNT